MTKARVVVCNVCGKNTILTEQGKLVAHNLHRAYRCPADNGYSIPANQVNVSFTQQVKDAMSVAITKALQSFDLNIEDSPCPEVFEEYPDLAEWVSQTVSDAYITLNAELIAELERTSNNANQT